MFKKMKKTDIPSTIEEGDLFPGKELEKNRFNAADLKDYFDEGVPIWVWYSLENKSRNEDGKVNYHVLLAYERGVREDFNVFYKKNDYILRCVMSGSVDNPYLLIIDIWKYSNRTALDIYHEEFPDAYKVFADIKKNTYKMKSVPCLLAEEEIAKKLMKHTKIHFMIDDYKNIEV